MTTAHSAPARLSFLLLVALASAAVLPTARAVEPGCLPQVRDGWLRLPPVPMPMLAGFGRIDNDCGVAATLTAVSSPAFDRVELHESRIVDGISRMRALPELRIAPQETAAMKPGGLHLMLMQPRATLAIGDTVAVEFALSDGRRVRGDFEVRSADAR